MNDKKITWVLIVISSLFLILILYLTSIEILYRDKYASSNLNSRALIKESSVMRGTIYDRDGEVLAYSEMDGDVQRRYYPHTKLYSHVIGYSSKNYGKSFIEKNYNSYLLGDDNLSAVFNIKNLVTGDMSEGYDLNLTIDHKTQKRAGDLMNRYRGALVALDPQTGGIIAMVSKPDFNPNETYLTAAWSDLNADENAPFLNRATMGLYPPGSTFKMVTAAIMHEQGMADDIVNDTEGFIKVDSNIISNTKGNIYGETDINTAFIRSSNVYFATAGVSIGSKALRDMAERMMFNKKTGINFPYAMSKFQTAHMGDAERAMTAIGQGRTLVSPLHLAMITGAIANNGVMMKPYIVSAVKTSGGMSIMNTSPTMLSQALSHETANFVKDMMVDTVKNGTGYNATIWGVAVGGKTGTAENELTAENPEKTHALFVSFAPAENPQIAVAVILEHAGSTGGSLAAPIAREVMKTYLGK